MFLLSACCLFGALAVDPAAVEFLGERAESEIHTGCVVYGGEYLKPPYVVKRMGNEVFINDRRIRWFVPWPIPKPVVRGVTKVMPVIPDGIDENTSEFDERVRKFGTELIDYFIYLGVTNRTERFATEIGRLPCVTKAHVISGSEVAIYWKNGTQGVPCNIFPERHDRRSKKWPQDKKTLQEISAEVKELAKLAREGGLPMEKLRGGTFTITNLGMYGIESFTPIINQPEVAILGVTTMEDRAVVRGGEIVIRPMMTLSLTFDHRVVDGSVAAEFLQRVKNLLENPALMLA